MNDTPMFTGKNWRPVHHRIEPIPHSDLLVRVLLIRHRRQPARSVLVTECLQRDEGRQELTSRGGSALMLRGVAPEVCRQMFDEAVSRLIPWRAEEDEHE